LTSWERYKKYCYYDPELGLMLDIGRMKFSESFFEKMSQPMECIYRELIELEKGSIANPDEQRMVGHYWLRNPDLAPTPELATEIRQTGINITNFVRQIHNGEIRSERGEYFRNILLIGIGGSSLGPRFVADALESTRDKMRMFFIDNTDPEGIDRIFHALGEELAVTLCIVISKSGGTIETRNGMVEAQKKYTQYGLNFPRHAIGITQRGSQLEQICQREGWLHIFPMWDWVGGRTSVLSAVGLLPLALQGIDIEQLLKGAKDCDDRTRRSETLLNPAALLSLMWYYFTNGQGGKSMVMLPYKDRLELFTKYLQQLIMESLGKEESLTGERVHQGIAVYGNKGSTDQHSYVQQLLDGPNNFFVTFIEVLKDRKGESPILAENSTSGDYLQAFLLGTREVLSSKGRESITITVKDLNAYRIGVLVALYERAVSIYALLVRINAYHQPAVEMGKKAAGEAIRQKNSLLNFLQERKGQKFTAVEIAQGLQVQDSLEILFKVLLHLSENPEHGVLVERRDSIFENLYYIL
jgi:glucose-6-phosphate isomerase